MAKKLTVEDIQRMRGDVVHNFTILEVAMSVFISKYYFGVSNVDFIRTIFYNDYMSFGLRLNIFEQINKREFDKKKYPLVRKKIDEQMDNLKLIGKIRNIFAHAWIETSSDGEEGFKITAGANLVEKPGIQELYDIFCEKMKIAMDDFKVFEDLEVKEVKEG